MDIFLTSTVTVALAEIGDKTQLLSLLLAARFHNKIALILGILAATIINHGLSAWFGDCLSGNFLFTPLPDDLFFFDLAINPPLINFLKSY